LTVDQLSDMLQQQLDRKSQKWTDVMSKRVT